MILTKTGDVILSFFSTFCTQDLPPISRFFFTFSGGDLPPFSRFFFTFPGGDRPYKSRDFFTFFGPRFSEIFSLFFDPDFFAVFRGAKKNAKLNTQIGFNNLRELEKCMFPQKVTILCTPKSTQIRLFL